MIIRSTVIIFLLLACRLPAVAQPVATEHCPGDKIFSRAEFPAVYKKGADSLKAFFNNEASSVIPPGTNGTIELKLIICPHDEAWLLRLENKTDILMDTAQWKRLVGDMKGWSAGRQNGRYISYYAELLLVIENGVIVKVRYSNGNNTVIESALHRSRQRIYTSSLFA